MSNNDRISSIVRSIVSRSSLNGGLTRFMGSGWGGPGLQNMASNVYTHVNTPGSMWYGAGALPLPLLGLMGGSAANIIGNLLFGASPEEKWAGTYMGVGPRQYTPRINEFNANNNWYRGSLPSLSQLAQNTKYVNKQSKSQNGMQFISGDQKRPTQVSHNEVFMNEKRKPFVNISGDDARKLGFKAKGDNYGVSLNRYYKHKAAYDHRQSVKAEENRGL